MTFKFPSVEDFLVQISTQNPQSQKNVKRRDSSQTLTVIKISEHAKGPLTLKLTN